MDSATLLRRCRRNDQNAWGYAYNYIIACMRTKAANHPVLNVQDIAQETILYWLDRGIDEKQIHIEHAFKNLLRLKANSIAIDQIRKHITRGEEPILVKGKDDKKETENPKIRPFNPAVLQDIICEQAILILKTALMDEHEHCWALLVRYFEGRFSREKSKEIAKEFGLNPNTFSTRVSRCLQHLKGLPEYESLLKVFNTD